MMIILLGLPGSGKGTLASKIEKKYDLKHISTGDMLREEVAQKTELGKKVQQIMNKGTLVDDKTMSDIVCQTAKRLHYRCILDGFPRTIAQAKSLPREIHAQMRVLFFQIDEEIVLKRLLGRLKCASCGADFNIYFHPPKEKNKCDLCPDELTHRQDDTETVIRKRLEVYRNETTPLIEHYRQQNLLIEIDASQNIKDVFTDATNRLEEYFSDR